MSSSRSPHILSASANLVGFSLIVLTAIKSLPIGQTVMLGRMAAVGIVCFAISSALSFMSIRRTGKGGGEFYERCADYAFFVGLIVLVAISFLVAFDIFDPS